MEKNDNSENQNKMSNVITEEENILDTVEPNKIKVKETKELEKPLKKAKTRKIIVCAVIGVLLLVGLLFLTIKVILPSIKYADANKNFENEEYEKAQQLYIELGDYKDSSEKAQLSLKAGHYKEAEKLFSEQKYAEAIEEYKLAADYENSEEMALKSEILLHYNNAISYQENK